MSGDWIARATEGDEPMPGLMDTLARLLGGVRHVTLDAAGQCPTCIGELFVTADEDYYSVHFHHGNDCPVTLGQRLVGEAERVMDAERMRAYFEQRYANDWEQAHALNITCTTCGAGPGQRCWTRTFKPTSHHAPRLVTS